MSLVARGWLPALYLFFVCIFTRTSQDWVVVVGRWSLVVACMGWVACMGCCRVAVWAAVSWPSTMYDRWATIWIQNQDVVLMYACTYCKYCIRIQMQMQMQIQYYTIVVD